MFAFSAATYGAPARIVGGMLDKVRDQDPAPVKAVKVIRVDHASGLAAGGIGTADVYRESKDSGFFNPQKSTDPGSMHANQMIFGNGWQPGDSINGFDLTILHSSLDTVSTADIRVTLWDGDPLGFFDTVCSAGGVPAPIPGTETIFAGVPIGAFRLSTTFPKIQYNCDPPDPDGAGPLPAPTPRVWMVYEVLSGCRAGWRLAGDVFGDPSQIQVSPPDVGDTMFDVLVVNCGEFCTCGPAFDQCNAGTCCDTGDVCDHSDGTFECAHSSFCDSGDPADSQLFYGVSDPAKYQEYYGREPRPHWSGDEDADWQGYTDANGNGQWDEGEPLNDDVGADGLGVNDFGYPGPDMGEGDGMPTPGEPNFDFTDKDESDQIGLTGFKIFPVHDFELWNEEQNWDVFRAAPPPHSQQVTANLGMFFSSGPFPLKAGQTEN
ncbi:MAG: hypothetical protein D6788_08130, partial [Planctomycetota bacterium]